MKVIVYEEVYLEEINDPVCDWQFQDDQDQDEAIEQMEVTLRVAELLEELGF